MSGPDGSLENALDDLDDAQLPVVIEKPKVPVVIKSPSDLRPVLPPFLQQKLDDMVVLAEQENLTDETIQWLVVNYWLGFSPGDLPKIYGEIEAKFPGGFDSYVESIDRMHGRGFRFSKLCLLSFLDSDIFPEKNADVFMRVCKLAMVDLDESIHHLADDKLNPVLLQMIEEDPDRFESIIIDFIQQSAVGPNGECSNHVFSYLLDHYNTPLFEPMLRNIEVIVDRAKVSGLTIDELEEVIWRYTSVVRDIHDYAALFPKKPDPFSEEGDYDYDDLCEIYCDVVVDRFDVELDRAWYFFDLAGAGLKPELIQEMMETEAYKCVTSEPLRSYYCAHGSAEGGVIHFWQQEAIKPELELVIRLHTEVERLLHLLRNLGEEHDDEEDEDPRVVFYYEHINAIVAGDKEAVQDVRRRMEAYEPDEEKNERLYTDPQMIDKADELLLQMKQCQGDPKYKDVCNFEKVIERLESAKRLAQFRVKLYSFTRSSQPDIVNTPLLANANQTTRLTIAGTSLLLALGVIQIPQLNQRMMGLPQKQFATEAQPRIGSRLNELIETSSNNGYWDQVYARVNTYLPLVDQFIRDQRMAAPGLMPIGSKAHVQRSVRPEMISFLQQTFVLDSTPFTLIHAGKSVVFPPLPSAVEHSLLLLFLECIGVVDPNEPQYQTAMAGRWSREGAARVGSAMLLGTRKGVRYKPGAFQTTHDRQTGARIMTYDALQNGVRHFGLPFDVPAATGRTDKMGCRSYLDYLLYQRVGTLQSHLEYGGPFEREAQVFRERYDRLMDKHGLTDTIASSAWVFQQAKPGDTLEMHERMVGQVSNHWFKGLNAGPERRFGVIGEVRELVTDMMRQMQARAGEIARKNPKEMEELELY